MGMPHLNIRALDLRCAKVSPPDSFILFANLAAAPDLKRLPDPCVGPNTPLLTQVSVSLVPYKPNVSYYYIPS